MRKITFLLVVFRGALLFMGAKKPKNINLRYDIECAGNGTQGSYLVKVWVYSKANKLDSEILKKYAIHGDIFKGYAGKTDCVQQKPLADSPAVEQQKADFFNAFFNTDKAFSKYATVVGGSLQSIKVGKEYKYGAVISVSKDMLRQDLEKAGVIRGLNTGF
jgi:hypothetical protein